jgi:serine/threonine-protein kinase
MTEAPRPLLERRPELPPRVAALVMRCLEKDPVRRFGDGNELLVALELLETPSAGSLGDEARWDRSDASVAVLPFANLSADPENEYFSDGITAEVLGALTRMHGLRVAASTSSFAFKGTSVDLRTVGERLGVRHVLEGSVRRSGTRVRIAVQLVNAADGLTLWNERFDRELADIFAVQDEIARSIVEALERTLITGEHRGTLITSKPRRRGAVNPEAFELYLRGRHLVEQRADGMEEALRCFQQAIQLAPDFSPSYAGVAYSLVAFGIYYALRPHDAFPRARDAADRALAIDPTDALALVMRAHTALWYEWNFESAEEMARRALELAPGLYLAHHCLGLVLAAQGQFEEAIAAMQRARSLDPLSEYAAAELAWVLILAGRWKQAIRELEPAVARHPLATELRRALGFCLFYADRLEEARAAFDRVLELNVGDRWACTNLVQTLAALGEVNKAQRLVAEIEQRAPHEPIPPLGIAIMHHWLGDDEKALDWLERSVMARDYWLVMMRFDPSMKRLRGNARFESLMRQVRADQPE